MHPVSHVVDEPSPASFEATMRITFGGGTLELTGTDDAGIVSASQNAEQAVQALIVLGYTQSEAAQAVAKLDGSLSTEELIRGALKSMASRF